MSTVTADKLMTVEEFLALPDDGVERWLSRGRLRENRGTDVTMRNRTHSVIEGRVTGYLFIWLQTQPEPRGEIVCGEAGFALSRNPDTFAGIDSGYITAAMADADPPNTTLFEGPPVLAVEILSPSDVHQDVVEKVRDYLAHGVLVWVVNPDFQTVTVHRPGQPPRSFNVADTLDGGPELPGFSVPVRALFR